LQRLIDRTKLTPATPPEPVTKIRFILIPQAGFLMKDNVSLLFSKNTFGSVYTIDIAKLGHNYLQVALALYLSSD